MSAHPVTPLLRLALRADALASGAVGAVLLLGADALAGPLGLSELLLRSLGVVLLAWCVGLWVLAARERIAGRVAWAVVVVNVVWAVESLLLPAIGWLAPTTLGTAFLVLQAAIVAGFAALQAVAIRGARRPMTA